MNKVSGKDRSGQRGPTEHFIREKILEQAVAHFRQYGYAKTTVSELANSIGYSKAYIYKFFESKQAIGQEICSQTLEFIYVKVQEASNNGSTAEHKLRLFFGEITANMLTFFFDRENLYEVAMASWSENWESHISYNQKTYSLLQTIIIQGREAGEFERKTPRDEVCRSILRMMAPWTLPGMLQLNLDLLPDGPREATSLVLRSLSH